MSNTKLTEAQITRLSILEKNLKIAVKESNAEESLRVASQIQELFINDRSHHRLLRAKLWAYEACIDANRLTFAESGLIGIKKLSAPQTRLYLEAISLLAVCFLRQKKTVEAKKLIKESINKINNITSDRTRHLYQKRLIERLEEESILTELIGAGIDKLNVKEIEEKAIELIQRNNEEEIFELLGKNIPQDSLNLLTNIRNFSVGLLPAPDQKLLPSPQKAVESKSIGKTTFAVLKRIAWKTFCKPSSPIYKMWSKKIPAVFNEGYFTSGVIATLADYKIGIPIVASGFAALVMKYSAEEFCEIAKPKGLMISRDEK